MAEGTNRDYWDQYYQVPAARNSTLPSQFAVFVLGEIRGAKHIVEFGCGSGRDSLFFAKSGLRVTGIDASATAIAACQGEAFQHEYPASFYQAVLGENAIIPMIWGGLPEDLSDTILYARFFLHAINEEAQRAFLDVASQMAASGATVAVEFRTHRDEKQSKVTESHYRRFINPTDFQRDVVLAGLKVDYFAEGVGFAKYGEDDAHVARFIIRKG
ncbi:methyltransferase domain-containing protein [Rhizobium sp. RCC_161_2]|uniref:methyltransferase domain-containing protein n=1 Tax=Rhizobium sp. RCC_161_2 TaxID=3239219 RepID=UPI0035232692